MPSAPANLDAIRGLACLLLVAYHVVGGSADNGLRLPDDHDARLLMDWLAHVRMPLFAALSGFLFAGRPPTVEGYPRFMAGKLRRLGIPLVVATALYVLLRWAVYREPPAAAAFVASYQHLWFLQASLVLLAVFGLAAARGRVGTPGLLTVVPVAAIAVDLLPWTTGASLSGALYLSPFFAFGMIARWHRVVVTGPPAIVAAFVIVTAIMALSAAHLLGMAGAFPRTGIALALCGCGWFALALRFVPAIGWLGAFGSYSYAIYLWHPLFGAAGRMAVQGLGVDANMAVAAVSFAAATGGPVLLHRVAIQMPVLPTLLLGTAGRRRPAAT